MVKRNQDIAKLQSNYLFAEIARRKQEFLDANSDAQVISLGIGDTTQPIPEIITNAFTEEASKLSHADTYTGYGPPFGRAELRERIAQTMYQNRISPEEVFISDGSKCDIGRLQILFGNQCVIGVQDPSYPAYVGSTVMTGKSGEADRETGQYQGIRYLSCTPENNFCPSPEDLKGVDVFFLCSPNNPTGQVFTRRQLEEYVQCAKQHKIIIVYDTAYAAFIRDPEIPKTIFEIDGAEEVALETGSFSKLFGFTGVRLGWTVVPEALHFDDGTPVRHDWMKVMTTVFNAPSNLAQGGGMAALTDEGMEAGRNLVNYYLQNVDTLRKAVESAGFKCYGGVHAPYLWIDLDGLSSWEMFDKLLHQAHLVTTPGVGFGPSGEGFLRMSAFGSKKATEEAAARINKVMKAQKDPSVT
ncbi:MAG: LL-diaminopimelate aminotransferase [Chlamydiota bacterium]